MWESFVVYTNAGRSGDSYWFDEKPQADTKGSKEQEVWL
jgi:hypothetical protein